MDRRLHQFRNSCEKDLYTLVSSQLVPKLTRTYVGQLVPTFWSTHTYPSQLVPILVNSNLFWLTRTLCKNGGIK